MLKLYVYQWYCNAFVFAKRSFWSVNIIKLSVIYTVLFSVEAVLIKGFILSNAINSFN